MSGHATDLAIGMMDGAYFTSRNEILSFINTLLDLNLAKIEQTASGAVACQIIEYIFLADMNNINNFNNMFYIIELFFLYLFILENITFILSLN